jgi:hypothetical protein
MTTPVLAPAPLVAVLSVTGQYFPPPGSLELPHGTRIFLGAALATLPQDISLRTLKRQLAAEFLPRLTDILADANDNSQPRVFFDMGYRQNGPEKLPVWWVGLREANLPVMLAKKAFEDAFVPALSVVAGSPKVLPSDTAILLNRLPGARGPLMAPLSRLLGDNLPPETPVFRAEDWMDASPTGVPVRKNRGP